VEALRTRLEAENAPEDLLADVWLAELSQLLPELRDRYPDLPLPMTGDPDFIRSRIFEAVARLVEALAARRPVVLFVDDIQWADEGSLDLLLYLSRRLTQDRTPVLVLLTARQEDLTTTVSLRDWLAGLGRDVPLTRLRLPALTPAVVQQLVGILAGQGSGDDVAEQAVVREFGAWLQAETGGVPFYVEAMLQMLIEQGVFTRRQGQGHFRSDVLAAWQHIQSEGRLPVPPGVREVILNRLSHLSDPASSKALAGSVIGRACGFERLCQVSSVAELEGLTALEELRNSRLMLEIGDELRPYSFAHDNIRQVVYTEAGEARRRLYHRRALSALTEGQGSPAELAYHALATRLTEPAFRYSVAAGDEAMRLSAVSEAVAHYENARQLLHDTPALEVKIDVIRLLYLRLGRARELQHRFQDALAIYSEMASLGRSLQSQSMELAALVAQGTIHALPYAGHDIVRAQVLADQALALARQLQDQAAEAKILWNYLLLHAYGTGDSAQAITYGEASVKIARETNLREQLAFTLNDLGMAYMTEGQHAAAESAFREAESILRGLDNRSMLGNSLNFLALLYLWQGKLDKALAYWDDCEVVTEALGSSNNYPFVAVNRSYVYLQTGQIERLLTRLEPLLRMDEASIQPLVHVSAYHLLALIHAALGAYEQGAVYCRQAISLHPRLPAYLRPPTFAILAGLLLGQGDLAQAQAAITERLVGFEPGNFSLAGIAYIYVPLAQTKVALVAGDMSQMAASLDYLFACYERLKNTIGKVEACYLQGKAAMSKGQTAAAYEALQAGRSLAEAIGNRIDLWPILWELSQLEAAAGNTDEAERLCLQAREIVTYIAKHTGSDELSASFLALPEVRAILSPSWYRWRQE
jgi:tetratricopeptide (TPR) repeat protein